MTSHKVLEERIGEWRQYFRRRQAVHSADVEELEDHLRSQIDTLRQAGLSDDEAFLVAVKRLGDLDSLSREFANEYSERLWKQLVVPPAGGASSPAIQRDTVAAVGLAVAAAVAIKVPELFGFDLTGPDEDISFYLRNFSLFVLPFLAVFFALKRELDRRKWFWVAVPFVAAHASTRQPNRAADRTPPPYALFTIVVQATTAQFVSRVCPATVAYFATGAPLAMTTLPRTPPPPSPSGGRPLAIVSESRITFLPTTFTTRAVKLPDRIVASRLVPRIHRLLAGSIWFVMTHVPAPTHSWLVTLAAVGNSDCASACTSAR